MSKPVARLRRLGFSLDDSSKPAPTHPVVARMYDWYLNGTHNYAVDRQAGQEVQRAMPDAKALVVENRAFLRRSVRFLAKAGITQFIDIGSGLPTAGNTHQVAMKINPAARVLYVDIEEMVVLEGREYIRQHGCEDQVGMLHANGLEPHKILSDAETKRIVDVEQPVAILMLALIHFWQPAQYLSVMDFWKSTLGKGSAFVMTHCTMEDRDPQAVKRSEDVYRKAQMPVYFRAKQDIAPIMDGWELVPPGLVRVHLWHMEEMEDGEEEPPRTLTWYGAMGGLV